MAILHPSVFYALWGGHCETLPSLNVLHFKGEYRQRSKHISKFFVRNSTLHIIAICRFNKKVKECKAGIRKGHKNLANFQNSFQVYYYKVEFHFQKKNLIFQHSKNCVKVIYIKWKNLAKFRKILFSGRFDGQLTQPFPFRSV